MTDIVLIIYYSHFEDLKELTTKCINENNA